MPAPKRTTAAQLQRQVDSWNAKHKVGTLVSFEEIVGDGETHRAATRAEATVLGGHTAVIFLEGKGGLVDLGHCKAVA